MTGVLEALVNPRIRGMNRAGSKKMTGAGVRGATNVSRGTNGLAAAVGCCLMLAACSKSESLSEMLAAQEPASQKTAAEPAVSKITTGANTPAATTPATTTSAATTPATTTPATDGKAELAKAT
ncbi:MAG TPA: hypothetical protein VFR73_11460 [Hyphomicrobiaceae bacterium]|nr:hypothetical protein [Hyphomicrobiaceae bacterium]